MHYNAGRIIKYFLEGKNHSKRYLKINNQESIRCQLTTKIVQSNGNLEKTHLEQHSTFKHKNTIQSWYINELSFLKPFPIFSINLVKCYHKYELVSQRTFHSPKLLFVQ